jgi:hypothetical protein
MFHAGVFVPVAVSLLCVLWCGANAQGTALVFTAKVATENQQVCLLLTAPVHLLVNWGDGSGAQALNTSFPDFCHVYVANRTYSVSLDRDTSDGGITQWLGRFQFPTSSAYSLIGIDSFGDLGINTLYHVSQYSSEPFYVPAQLPRSVTDLSSAFYAASTFNCPNVTLWNTSAVTSLSRTFAQAALFNQPVGGWDTSSVTSMMKTFDTGRSFNQPLNDWDTSKVQNMENMFEEADVFNQPIFAWDTSSVTAMPQMFQMAFAFNQYISNWNVSQVTDMNYMFNEATAFNQNLTSWCVQQIATEPYQFKSSSEWTLIPVWGTCPAPATRPASPVAPPANPPTSPPQTAPLSVPFAAPTATPLNQPIAVPQIGSPIVSPVAVPSTRTPVAAPTVLSGASRATVSICIVLFANIVATIVAL